MKPTVHFLEDAPDYAMKSLVESSVVSAINEARQHLPELPAEMKVWLGDAGLISDVGSGGFAYAPNIINIVFDPHFPDKEAQRGELRGVVFHELYHAVQGYTYEDSRVVRGSMLDDAIYEGLATRFEHDYTESVPLWGDFSRHSAEDLQSWLEVMLSLHPDDYRNDGELFKKWSFYDPEDGIRWKKYKTGAWIVDRALKASGKDIVDLRHVRSGREVLDLIDKTI